jgi:hypothetical protein
MQSTSATGHRPEERAGEFFFVPADRQWVSEESEEWIRLSTVCDLRTMMANEVCTRKREVAMEGSRSEEAVVEWSKEL